MKLLGNAVSVPIADVDFTWDAGRLKTVSQAGHQVTYNYAGQDVFPTSVVGPMGRTLEFLSRDGSGRPTRMKLPSTPGAERYVDLEYDASGNLSVLRPPKGSSFDHAMSWNAVNALDAYAPPQMAQQPFLSPKDTLYGYDRDRLLRTDATPSGTVTYTYDQGARVGTRQHPHATTSYSYHPDTGRLAEVADSGGLTLGYTWSGPHLTKLSYGGTAGSTPACGNAKHCLEYEYFGAADAAEKRGKKKWRQLDGSSASRVSFDYDAEGGLSTVTWGSYVYTLDRGGSGSQGFLKSTSVGSVTETFDYDQWGALSSQVVQAGGAECFKIADVIRDDVGRINHKRETVLGAATNWDYTYHDQEGWLRSSNDFGPMPYDKNGNRADGTRTFDTQDRVASDYWWPTWSWTNDGALSSIANQWQQYYWTFDLLGNQRAAWGPGRNRSYAIDGRDRRVIVYDSGNVVRQYLWDEDDRLVAQLDAWGNVWMQFVYASRSHVPDLLLMGSSLYRLVHDQVGSVRLVLDASSSSCNAVQRVDYTTWGVPTFSGAWGGGYQPFGFAGGLYDEVTTQTRFGAREYDAWGGRWFTKDRSRFDGGINLYAYCENDPVNCIDPTGYTPQGARVGAAIGFGVGLWAAIVTTPGRAVAGAAVGAETGGVLGIEGGPGGVLAGGVVGGAGGASVGAGLGALAVVGGATVAGAVIGDAVSSDGTCAARSEDGCVRRADSALRLCLASGRPASECARAWWITFRGCMGLPEPPPAGGPN